MKNKDKNEAHYLVKFKNNGVIHHRTLKTNKIDEIKTKLAQLGYYDVVLVETTKVL